MDIAMTRELDTEGELGLFEVVVAVVSCGVDPNADTLPGIEEGDTLRSIYES
jgi:hypothetical protein